MANPAHVLAFWREAGPERWFKSDQAFDAAVRERFLLVHEKAVRGELSDWEETPPGALALVILLDQFPRNMFRSTPRAFATDPIALKTARRAVARAFDRQIEMPLRNFFYMPFMHSEYLAMQEQCLELMHASGDKDGIKYAEIHRDIIRRFGRFPHRNKILGRASTSEEVEFLASGGFAD
jgi:uncharacterized protein (DUF924 family)